MIKKNVLAYIILIGFLMPNKMIGQNNLHKQIDKGEIKKVTSKYFHIDKENKYGEINVIKSQWSSSVYSYDKKGRIVLIENYDNHDKLTYRSERIFNDEENSKSSVSTDEGGVKKEYITYYDEEGNFVKDCKGLDDDPKQSCRIFSYTYSYNDDGKLISKLRFDKDGELDIKEKWEYYTDGTLKMNHDISYGDSATMSEYNEEGKITKMYLYDRNGDLGSVKHYKYDSYTKKLESYKKVSADGVKLSESFVDLYGNPIIFIEYFKDGYKIRERNTINYKYDEQGNWVSLEKIRSYPNNDVGLSDSVTIDERDIEYY